MSLEKLFRGTENGMLSVVYSCILGRNDIVQF